MAEPLQPIQTIRYKTYLKETFVEALKPVFASHADALFRGTKVTIETPFTEAHYPAIVIRFYERTIKNMGVGHQEWFPDEEVGGTGPLDSRFIRYKHSIYTGDVEFAIYALSSLERDLLSDSLVQIISMSEMEPYTSTFLQRIYYPNLNTEPGAQNHMINVNTDVISGMGETQAPAPWQPEDVLVYQAAYRLGVMGEFYSRTPAPVNYGVVTGVDTFPWNPDAGETEPVPDWPGPDHVYGTGDDEVDPAPWEGTLPEPWDPPQP